MLDPKPISTSAKKRLLVILGAGSSISNGMPSVTKIDSEMKSWAAAWARDHACSDFYRLLWRNLERHYTGDPGRTPNFELALGGMIGLAHWLEPRPYGNPLRSLVGVGRASRWKFLEPRQPFTETSMVSGQATALLMRLAGHMRAKSLALDLSSLPFLKYRALAEDLQREFQVGIYSLNYDNVALEGFRNLYHGFAPSGAFDSTTIHNRESWDFIYHLHGSVHHSLAGTFGERITWQNDLTSTFDDGREGLSPDELSDGKSFPRTTLIAGGFKLDQLLHEPFQSFYSSLVRHAASADAILIGGYGFGDEHVNRVLQNRLSNAPSGARPPVAVLTWSGDNTDPTVIRHDSWASNLKRNLHIIDDFGEPGHAAPPMIKHLRDGQGFEVAPKSRVAIWHGGFTEVDARGKELLQWLSSAASDDVLGTVGP